MNLSKKLAAVFAAAGIAGGALWLSLPGSLPPAPKTLTSTGITPDADVKRAKIAIGELASRFDRDLVISFAKGKVTRAPVYDDLEALSRDLGMQKRFDAFYERAQAYWIGIPPGAGGIYTSNANPQGLISTMSENWRINEVLRVGNLVVNFAMELKNNAGYAAKINGRPQAKALLDDAPQFATKLLLAQGQPVSNMTNTHAVLSRHSETKPLLNLLPSINDEPSQAFRVLQATAVALGSLNYRNFTSSTDQLNTYMHRNVQDSYYIAPVCDMVNTWKNLDANMRSYNDYYTRAVALVQKDMQVGTPGINVQRILDTSRDTAVTAEKALYKLQPGFSCIP